jgi:hypothetical protein
VGDRLGVAVRADADLPGRKPLAKLEQPRLGHEVARGGLAQEVDVEIDGHRQRHGADRGEHRHVHGKVRERHHGRAGNRTAGSYRDVAKRLPDPAAPLPHGFDREPTVRMEKLRKLGAKKPLDFLDRHHSRHAPPSRRNRTRPLGLKEKLGRRRT